MDVGTAAAVSNQDKRKGIFKESYYHLYNLQQIIIKLNFILKYRN